MAGRQKDEQAAAKRRGQLGIPKVSHCYKLSAMIGITVK